MVIREASMNDLEKIIPIFLEGYIFHYEGRKDVFPTPNELLLRDELIENLCSTDKKIIVLFEDDNAIGYIQYVLKHNNTVLKINEFVIKSDKRHMGYGKKMLEYIESKAREIKAKRVELECWNFNTNALNFYKNNEFLTQRTVFEKDITI